MFSVKMKKNPEIFINKPVYLGLSILDLSVSNCNVWILVLLCKTKFCKNAKLFFMNADSFIVHIKTDDICKHTAEDDKARFDTWNFEIHRPLSKQKNRKLLGLMKGELGGKIMKEFVGSRAKTYSYLKYDNDEDKKSKRHEKVCH